MKLKSNSRIVIFTRLFVFMAMGLALLDMIDALMIFILKKDVLHTFGNMGFYYELLMCFMLTIFAFMGQIHEAKAMRIDDFLQAKEKTIRILNMMGWKLIEDSDTRLVFRTKFDLGILRDKVTVRFVDEELQISGAHNTIDNFIRKAKFPYRPFEISTFE